MDMKRTMTGLLTAFLVVVLASQSLAWWGGGKPKRPSHDKRIEMIARRLKLTDEQKKKFLAHQAEMKKAMLANRKQVKEVGNKLKAELKKDAPDRKKVHARINEINELQRKMQIRRVDSLLDLRKSLSPEQRKKFRGMIGPLGENGHRDRHRKR